MVRRVIWSSTADLDRSAVQGQGSETRGPKGPSVAATTLVPGVAELNCQNKWIFAQSVVAITRKADAIGRGISPLELSRSVRGFPRQGMDVQTACQATSYTLEVPFHRTVRSVPRWPGGGRE